jgi:hypothetical protein
LNVASAHEIRVASPMVVFGLLDSGLYRHLCIYLTTPPGS